MKVNFKGLYVIPGSDSRAKGKGYTMQNVPALKLQDFLKDTKPLRSISGYSFYDYKTGDYYMAVSDKYDYAFEYTAAKYNIDYQNVGSKVARNSASAEEELALIGKAMMTFYKDKITGNKNEN